MKKVKELYFIVTNKVNIIHIILAVVFITYTIYDKGLANGTTFILALLTIFIINAFTHRLLVLGRNFNISDSTTVLILQIVFIVFSLVTIYLVNGFKYVQLTILLGLFTGIIFAIVIKLFNKR